MLNTCLTVFYQVFNNKNLRLGMGYIVFTSVPNLSCIHFWNDAIIYEWVVYIGWCHYTAYGLAPICQNIY
jgi:hypothetical protein